MSLAEKLVILRKQKGLTQMDLAEQLNVSRQAISRWEVGAAVPSTDNLKVLGELYGVPIDYLLNDNTADTKSTRVAEENPIDKESTQKRKYKPLLICIAVIAIAVVVMLGALVPRNNQDQTIPMEDMYTGPDEGYSEGTFEIE